MAKNKRGVAHSARRRRQAARAQASAEDPRQTTDATALRRCSFVTYNSFDEFEWVEMPPLRELPTSETVLLW